MPMARCYVTVSSAYDIDLNTDIIPAFDLGTMDFESDEENRAVDDPDRHRRGHSGE